MKIIVAEKYGMCFGVRDALALARKIDDPGSVTIHGELVHNEIVLNNLYQRGFSQVSELNRNFDLTKRRVMITAHGISDKERQNILSAGREIVDATCPLVTHLHTIALKLSSNNFFIVLVGKRNHVEVKGLIEDLSDYAVVENPEEVRDYDRVKIGVICQTTMSKEIVLTVLDKVRNKNPQSNVQFQNTICSATRDRQDALSTMLPMVDSVIIVGGKNSNNTLELHRIALNHGKSSHHIQSASELKIRWFRDRKAVGLTAGASTPEETVEEVIVRLKKIGKLISAQGKRKG